MENNFALPGGNSNSNSTGDSWFSQGKNLIKLIVGGAFAAVAVYYFATYVLPFLKTFAWNLVSLSVATIILGVLFYVFVLDRRIYSRLNYLYEAILELTLGWLVDFDPFVIAKHQIEEKEQDRETLKKEGDKVDGKKIELEGQVKDNMKLMEKTKAMIDELKSRIASGKLSEEELEDDNMQLQLQANNFGRYQTFINAVSPTMQDLAKISAFARKAYKYSGIAIEDAKQELKIQMATYSAVNSGERAMNSALKAFRGNSQTNKDAEFALQRIQATVSQKVANIRSAIDITSQYMNAIELNNSAEARQIMTKIDSFNVEAAFSNPNSKAALQSNNGQYLADVKVNTDNKYMDLIKK